MDNEKEDREVVVLTEQQLKMWKSICENPSFSREGAYKAFVTDRKVDENVI
jgi:Tol biopolymer transport system component